MHWISTLSLSLPASMIDQPIVRAFLSQLETTHSLHASSSHPLSLSPGLTVPGTTSCRDYVIRPINNIAAIVQDIPLLTHLIEQSKDRLCTLCMCIHTYMLLLLNSHSVNQSKDRIHACICTYVLNSHSVHLHINE
jgi:hypothetical protein